jgi:hypothetical protein
MSIGRKARRKGITDVLRLIMSSLVTVLLGAFVIQRFFVARANEAANCLWPRRLGLGWGARPSRLPFSASRRKPFPKLNGSTHGSGATPEPARETRALPPFGPPQTAFGCGGCGPCGRPPWRTATGVAAGILPAVEPWLPARRRKPSATRTPHLFCDAVKSVRLFRAAGIPPSTSGKDARSYGARIVPMPSRGSARSTSPIKPASKLSRPSLVVPPAASWDNSRSGAGLFVLESGHGMPVR